MSGSDNSGLGSIGKNLAPFQHLLRGGVEGVCKKGGASGGGGFGELHKRRSQSGGVGSRQRKNENAGRGWQGLASQ